MNEFEDLLNSVSQVEPGDVVTAEVLTVDANQANVAISGTGVEGVLTLRELTNDRDADINDLVKPGETLELLVLRQVVGKDTDTVTYLVSKKRLEARKAWDKLVGREEEVVTVKGTRAVKGGLSVEFEGLRGFIPASMLDTRFVRNTERFVGQEFDAKIKEVDAKENRFILSRREVGWNQATLEVVSNWHSKNGKDVFFCWLYSYDISDSNQKRTKIECSTCSIRWDIFFIGTHYCFTSFHKHIRWNLRHQKTISSPLQAFGIFIWTEQLNTAIFCTVGFQPLESLLSIVQTWRRFRNMKCSIFG